MSGLVQAAGAAPLSAIVNRCNPMDSISRQQLRQMLLGHVREWPDRQIVTLVERDADSEAYKKMLRVILRLTEPEYRYSLNHSDLRGESSIKTLNSNETAGEFVDSVPGALAIIDSATSNRPPASGIKVLRIDGRLPGEPGYALE